MVTEVATFKLKDSNKNALSRKCRLKISLILILLLLFIEK